MPESEVVVDTAIGKCALDFDIRSGWHLTSEEPFMAVPVATKSQFTELAGVSELMVSKWIEKGWLNHFQVAGVTFVHAHRVDDGRFQWFKSGASLESPGLRAAAPYGARPKPFQS